MYHGRTDIVTLINVANIILHGLQGYKSLGTADTMLSNGHQRVYILPIYI